MQGRPKREIISTPADDDELLQEIKQLGQQIIRTELEKKQLGELLVVITKLVGNALSVMENKGIATNCDYSPDWLENLHLNLKQIETKITTLNQIKRTYQVEQKLLRLRNQYNALEETLLPRYNFIVETLNTAFQHGSFSIQLVIDTEKVLNEPFELRWHFQKTPEKAPHVVTRTKVQKIKDLIRKVFKKNRFDDYDLSAIPGNQLSLYIHIEQFLSQYPDLIAFQTPDKSNAANKAKASKQLAELNKILNWLLIESYFQLQFNPHYPHYQNEAGTVTRLVSLTQEAIIAPTRTRSHSSY